MKLFVQPQLRMNFRDNQTSNQYNIHRAFLSSENYLPHISTVIFFEKVGRILEEQNVLKNLKFYFMHK